MKYITLLILSAIFSCVLTYDTRTEKWIDGILLNEVAHVTIELGVDYGWLYGQVIQQASVHVAVEDRNGDYPIFIRFWRNQTEIRIDLDYKQNGIVYKNISRVLGFQLYWRHTFTFEIKATETAYKVFIIKKNTYFTWHYNEYLGEIPRTNRLISVHKIILTGQVANSTVLVEKSSTNNHNFELIDGQKIVVVGMTFDRNAKKYEICYKTTNHAENTGCVLKGKFRFLKNNRANVSIRTTPGGRVKSFVASVMKGHNFGFELAKSENNYTFTWNYLSWLDHANGSDATVLTLSQNITSVVITGDVRISNYYTYEATEDINRKIEIEGK